MSVREAFAANLSRLCEGERSIASVCRSTQINRQQFNRYLSGGSIPSARNLEKICRHFGIDEPELFRKPSEEARARSDNDGEPWSHTDLRSTLKRLYRETPSSVQPGLYFAHFAYPPDPGSVVRSTVIVRREGNLTTFRRLTGFAEPSGSWWSHFHGDHQGIVLERRGWLYFDGLNNVASQEPTLMVLRWVPDAEPMLGGFATILTPDGPTVTAVVLNSCGPRATLRTVLRSSHVYSVDDARIDPIILDALDEQCERLIATVRRLDLTVTPELNPKRVLGERSVLNGRR